MKRRGWQSSSARVEARAQVVRALSRTTPQSISLQKQCYRRRRRCRCRCHNAPRLTTHHKAQDVWVAQHLHPAHGILCLLQLQRRHLRLARLIHMTRGCSALVKLVHQEGAVGRLAITQGRAALLRRRDALQDLPDTARVAEARDGGASSAGERLCVAHEERREGRARVSSRPTAGRAGVRVACRLCNTTHSV